MKKEMELTREEWEMIRDAERANEGEDFAEFALDYEEEEEYGMNELAESITNDERYQRYCFNEKFIEVEEADIGTSVHFHDGSTWYCQMLEWCSEGGEEVVTLLDIYERMIEEGVDLDTSTSVRK